MGRVALASLLTLFALAGSAFADGRGSYGGYGGMLGLYLLAPFALYGLWKLLNDRTGAIYGWIIIAGVVALGGFYKGLVGAGEGAYLIGGIATIVAMILYRRSRGRG
ncbi:hypothetical protein ABNQ39_22545 [Azospirillum sp. A26]|uniref:hypothetical protein n=1 Tax=Azospirillum sp. A26 TaxID=3160607 RepID=UPI00366E9CF4